MSDADQKSTYAAEDLVAGWIDAACPDSGEVTASVRREGRTRQTTFRPEAEPRFSRPSEVAGFVEAVMDRLRQQARQYGSNYRGREQRDVRVVAHSGWRKASYGGGVIRLPARERGGGWALRGLVVLHELAHHLNTGDGAIIDAHGAGFRATFVRLLEDIGWTEIAAMLREAFEHFGLDRDPDVDHGMLAKVGKLLRHAEGATTDEERETFFAKAQELATTHSIELAVARATHERSEADRTPTFETVQLGHRGQQSNVRFVELMLAIALTNDLRCTIRGDNTGVNLYGFDSDIEVTKMLYVSLVVQMVGAADAYLRSGAHRPVHGRTARAAFYAGWTARIGQRLLEAKESATSATEARDEPAQGQGPASGSTALALLAKDAEVEEYFTAMKHEHGVKGTWKGGGAVDDPRSSRRGRAAADLARLGGEKAISA